MFDLNGFLDMIARHRYTKTKLAKTLCISLSSLYRRLENGGTFTVDEIRLMMTLFGKDEVLKVFFA